MSTYTRAEVDAEIHKLLKSTQEMFEEFAASDVAYVKDYRERGPDLPHYNWMEGRVAAYKLAAEHMDRLKEGYEGASQCEEPPWSYQDYYDAVEGK